MTTARAADRDDDSDYGSDFDEEQADLVNQVLGDVPAPLGSTPPLLIRDIEDHEGPSGAKIPLALGEGRIKHHRASLFQEQIAVGSSATVQIELDRSCSTQGKSAPGWFESACLTDVKASSRKP